MRRVMPILVVAVLALLLVGHADAKGKKKKAPASTATAPVTLATGSQQALTASCPKGMHVTGGGWSNSAPFSANGTDDLAGDTGLRILPLESQPTGPSLWSAGAAAFSVPGGAATFSAIARCERKSISKTAVGSQHTSLIAAGSEGTISEQCPGGTHVLTGGFAFSPAGDLNSPQAFRPNVRESRRLSANTWQIDLINPTGAASPVTLITSVVCELNSKGTNLSERSAVAAIPDNSRAAATASCTGKTHSVGGGFQVTPTVGPAVSIDQSQPSGAKGWQVGLYEYPGFALPAGSTLTAYSYCRKN